LGNAASSRRVARFEGFVLDLRAGELCRAGERAVNLAEQPLRILAMLLERPRDLVSREEIRAALWPNGTVVEFEHSISAAINRLRQVLGDSAEDPRFIETLARRGYRWKAGVEWIDTPQAAASESPARANGNWIGKKVSHYRVLEILGGGGMGVVYKAEDLKLGRSVALKFLPEELAHDSAAMQRFEREARAASALNHPNICTIYEVEEHEGQPFIVMELLEGRTLREMIPPEKDSPAKDLPIALPTLLDIALRIIAGLEAAHCKGIVHRDIKPANVFVTSSGHVKILDFGLAKLQTAETSEQEPQGAETSYPKKVWSPYLTLTRTGTPVGTAGYMSPEQIRGEKLDARTDLFNLGLVLYEMAAGRRAFAGETAPQLQEAILNATPAPVRQSHPQIPPKLEATIVKALEKNREARYQSAAEMRADLESIRLKGAPGIRARKWAILAGGITTALVLMAGIALRIWLPQYRGVRPDNVEFTRLTDSGRAENVAISPDGRYVVYSQHESAGVGLWVRPVATRNDMQILPPEVPGFEGLSFSPDGDYVYFVRPDNNDPGFKFLYVLPALGGTPRQLVTDIDSAVSFSPDGRRFVYTRGIPKNTATEIRIADADGGNNHLLVTLSDTAPDYQPGATWSPDGATIAVPLWRVHREPRFMLYTIRVADASVTELFPSAFEIGRALWQPEGNALLAVLNDKEERGQLWSISYSGKQARRITNDLSNYDNRPDLTRAGNTLALVNGKGISNLWVADADRASEARRLTSLNLPLETVVEAPNGKLLVSSGGKLWAFTQDGMQHEPFGELDRVIDAFVCNDFVVFNNGLDLMRSDLHGSNPVKLASRGLGPACSPNDRYVFYVEPGPPEKIWRISVDGGTPVEIANVLGESLVGPLTASPDGKLLAYTYEEFTTLKVKIAIIPASGGPPFKTMDAPGALYGASGQMLNWSPDGKSLEYFWSHNGASNIWEQPLDRGQPRQRTFFTSGQISDFSWSIDKKRIFFIRGENSADVVLLTHLR